MASNPTRRLLMTTDLLTCLTAIPDRRRAEGKIYGQAGVILFSILLDGLRQGERCSSSSSFCPWRTGTVGHWTAWRSTNSSRLSWASIPSSSSLIHTFALELGETVHMVLAEVG